MAQVKTFQKDGENLNEYEENIRKGLEIAQEYGLIPEEIRNALREKVQQETQIKGEFIKRKDMENLYENMKTISEKENLISAYKNNTAKLMGKDIATAYEYVSIAEDILHEEKKIQEKQKEQQEKEETIKRLQEKEAQEKEQIQDLEKLLDEIE